MPYIYSTPERENDTYALPDIQVCQMTAREVAEMMDETIGEYMRMPRFRLAAMNRETAERMFDTMIEEEGIVGGWGWWFCLPGCTPDSDWNGPFPTRAEAEADAREHAAEWED